jgi:hypothetical protein
MTRRFHSFLIFFVLIAGCAEMRWQKPGVEADAIDDQLHECIRLSRRERGGVPAYYAAPEPQVVFTGAAFGGPTLQTRLGNAKAVLRELELTDRCMREKGYTLVPAETAGGRGRE